MAVYEGKAGIAALRDKIKNQSETLVREIAKGLVENLVEHGQDYIGDTTYAGVEFPDNDPGRFVNSWYTGDDVPSLGFSRNGDRSGIDSISQAQFLKVDLGKTISVVNSTPEAIFIEKLGWNTSDIPSREQYGWDDKNPYSPVYDVSQQLSGIVADAIEEAKRAK